MRNPVLLLITLLLPLFTGCVGMDQLKLAQDRPEDLQQLLEQNEFARARQLTGKYPAIDSHGRQQQITAQENAYEKNIIARARKLESGNDLLGAVQLLSGTLQKIPASKILREYRNRLEKERLEKVMANERRQLIARATYVLNQKEFYERQNNLKSLNIIQRWENTRNNKESETLAKKLRIHGEHALRQEDLQIAMQCLQLSKSLDNTPETQELLEKLASTRDVREEVALRQTRLNKEKKRSLLKQRQAEETRKLVEITRQALLVDELALAHATFRQIPSSANESSKVRALREDLERAVKTRVNELTSRGDSKYRADDVDTAIRIWSEALELDPENQQLNDRLDRATRVLTRLEQLKQQQAVHAEN